MFTLVYFLVLVIIGGFVYWFGCSLLFLLLLLFFSFNNILFILITSILFYSTLLYSILFYSILFRVFLFFLPFLLSSVADKVLVLWPGVRPKPLGWETRVQNIGPQETSRPQVITIGESSPRDLHLNAKTQLHSTTSKLQC